MYVALCVLPTMHCYRRHEETFEADLWSTLVFVCVTVSVCSYWWTMWLATLGSCRLAESESDFTSTLCQNLISLIPTIVLFPSAASLHWLLRMIAHFSQPPLVQFAFRECLRLLLQLAQQLRERSNLKSQVLQTRWTSHKCRVRILLVCNIRYPVCSTQFANLCKYPLESLTLKCEAFQCREYAVIDCWWSCLPPLIIDTCDLSSVYNEICNLCSTISRRDCVYWW